MSDKKRIVLDTNILRWAAEGSIVIEAQISRDILDSIRIYCHKAVTNPLIKSEWDKHKKQYATKWITAMRAISEEKFINYIMRDNTEDIIKNANGIQDIYERTEFNKDAMLFGGAILSDRIILSFDDKARKRFIRYKHLFEPDLQEIMWVNPKEHPAEIITWLNNGCPLVETWQLKNYTPQT